MIQFVIIIAYLLFTIGIGLATRKKADALSYEGNSLGLLMCVAIGAGEWMGGTSTTGVSEYGFLYGISGAWYTIANGLGICFLGLFFAKMFRRLNSSTVPEIIGRYLGRQSRIVSSIVLILVLVIVGVSQMIAIGTIGETLFHWKPAVSILVLGAVVLVYTCTGGMKAIGLTNILHLIVMYAGILLALLLCISRGVSLRERLAGPYFSMGTIGTEKISSWIIASVLGACTAQAGLQPILKSKDEKTAVLSSFIIALIVSPFGIMTALLGMYARAMLPQLQNAKLALPALLSPMDPAVSGIVLAAILAAVLSTASPIFLSVGTLITRDIYSAALRGGTSDRRLLFVSRTATMAAGTACVLLAILLTNRGTILEIVYFAYSLRGSLFVVLLCGIYLKWMDPKSAIYAMIFTSIMALFWIGYQKVNGSYPIPGVSETYVAIFTTVLVILVVSAWKRGMIDHMK